MRYVVVVVLKRYINIPKTRGWAAAKAGVFNN